MHVAFVSDERYVALADVLLEFIRLDRPGVSIEARSRSSGSVHADLEPGPYKVVLSKPGYGSKTVTITVQQGADPLQFRLLTDGLLGYAWPKWVRGGEKSEYRVHSVEPYKLELWRYGKTKELVKSLGWLDEHGPRATMQISPDGDYTQTGVRWNTQGYTNPHHKQYVEAPERSGLYYFHASTAKGVEFGFPWIVAPDRPQCGLAVLASNITWNAYNSFGGRSNYINADELPPTPTINSRQDLQRYTDPNALTYGAEVYAPLSFDRPELFNHIEKREQATDPIEGRASCHLASAEWRLLAWLERENFPYDYYAESQLHSGVLDLNAYQVLIISTHPEYWSMNMYQKLKSWVQGGGKLMYLGGNGINCEVEISNDGSAMIVKNGDARDVQARGLESRFHLTGESEAALLGVVFDDRGIMTSAPYQVTDETHWALQGTGLKNGDLFGKESLHRRCPGGASGHETDKVSKSSPRSVKVFAQGTNIDNGGADLITHDNEAGGCVFSAGSITWPSAILVDDHVSKITANVLTQFLAR